MELRVLRYFLAVAREESISGAAEALHVTQPTLSRQMMELEEELGKTLFLRGKRKISLTEEGMFLRKRAQEIVTLVEKTESEFSAAEETISGDVHIGGGETDAMRLIARAAHRLQSAYPHIAYHLFSGNADDVTERLDRGLVDFGVFIEPADSVEVRLHQAAGDGHLGRADAKRLPSRGKGNDKAAGSAGPSAPRFQPASGEKRIFRMVRRRL
ncbi:MAG: LysR family transcriptional regulator [Bilophila wadsworthia]|uniref:LysR family transcriptional regulator n=1 Tax=Bilophila wadsworthia TaxID=35833 RepID=UPI00300E7B3D